MSESFDPYLKWFGIPPKDRPIHHYRLLAIEIFEADAEVIENAADQRMAHLKRFNTGKHSALAEKLLNEVAAARVCLLNPAKKAGYDEELRRQLAGRDSAVPAGETPAAVAPPPIAASAADSFLTQFETEPGPPRRTVRPATKKTKTKSKTPWVMLLAVIAGLAAVALIALLTAPPGGGTGGSAAATPKDQGDHAGAAGKGTNHGAEAAAATPAGAEGKKPAVPAQVPPAAAPQRLPPPQPAKPDVGSPAKPEEGSPAKPDEPSPLDLQGKPAGAERPGDQADQPDKMGAAKPAVSNKLSLPNEAARKTAEQKFRNRYQSDLANADSNAEKSRLADRLVRDADNLRGDPAERLVTLQQAVSLARDAGDLGKAAAFLDKIGQTYDINVVSQKVDLVQNRADELANASGAGAGAKGLRQQQFQQASRELLDVCRGLTTAAIDQGDVETALRCLKIALPAATRVHDVKTKTMIQSTIKDVEKLQKRLAEVQAAKTVLHSKPDDPEANLALGSWYCLITGDWNTGLPWLSKGSDAELAEAAKQDLAKPGAAADQAALGNLWWSLGEKKSGLESARLKNRAAHWYTLALPTLSGAVETKIRKRLESLGATGQYALEFDGRGTYVLFRNLIYAGTTPITIEAVVKVNRDNNWGRTILIGNGDRDGLSLGYENNRWFFRVDTLVNPRTGRDRNFTVSGAADEGNWTHVAAVYDGREIRLYVDGHRRDRQMINGPHKPGDIPFVLGALLPPGNKGSAGNCFKGLVRAVRISKAALYTEDFVPPLLSNGPATVAVFNFIEGRGDRLRDAAGRKIFGEIHDAQWVKLSDAEPRP